MTKRKGVGKTGGGGGNRCYVCTAPSIRTKFTRAQIEKLLVTNPNKSEIARQTGVGKDALIRHFKVCVPALVEQLEEFEIMGTRSLIQDMTRSRAKYHDMIDGAEDEGKMLLAARLLDQQVITRGTFNGTYKTRTEATVTLQVSDVAALVQQIGAKLSQYPDAIADVTPLLINFEKEVLQLDVSQYDDVIAGGADQAQSSDQDAAGVLD